MTSPVGSNESISASSYEYQELNPEGQHTILLVGGISEGISTQAGLSEALADNGFRVISYDYTREPAPVDNSDLDYFPRYRAQKVEQLEEILSQTKREDEKVTLLAHSMGGPLAVAAALTDPEAVDRLILTNTSGLFPDSFPRLGGRFAVETVRKIVTPKKLAQKQQLNGTKELVGHHKSFFGDAVDIAHADIRDDVRKLRELGIRVDVLMSAKDQVNPWRLVGEGLNPNKEVSPLEIAVDGISSYFTQKVTKRGKTKQHRFASKWAGHDQPIIYPQQTARLVKQLMEQ